jgi:hypothetical protein
LVHKSAGTTTKKIQERLGVAPNVFPGVVIIRVTNSFNGLASSDFWEWLAAAFEPEDG